MARSTIDFGIDLGTTNSEIAVFTGDDTTVIKNNDNFENTASAVWINRRGGIVVGRRAKEQHELDELNAKIEFKRQMGTAERFEFADSGKKMLAEELSAEVLKLLKTNVQNRLGEDVAAAVITVPADFNAAQIEATSRAARLAGIETSPLLQEPVAAAMAYGFRDEATSRAHWLVYDLGGGTFDAALMQVREDRIRVVKQGGDKFLGGKNIDHAIVQDILVPALLKQARLSNFTRNNARWRSPFAKLKIAAENAKIQLSSSPSAFIDISHLCDDDEGRKIDFEYELHRKEVETAAESVIATTIRHCREVISAARLTAGDIEKVILVGGPTLMPYLRSRLADARDGLGITLEFRVDPFTVVARGAAIFAGMQPNRITDPPKIGEYNVELDYRAIGEDTDPPIAGQVIGSGAQDFSGFTIEFSNGGADIPWRSGKFVLSPDGRFLGTLWAEKGKKNVYRIELLDARGTKQKTNPEEFPYTVERGGVDAQLLPHDVGIALADNTVLTFFKEGTPLPARMRETVRTVVDARRGSTTDAIRVPVVEGKEKRADRNEVIGALVIPAVGFARDVPAGSEVDVMIEASESRQFLTKAYIPMLDEEFEIQLVKTVTIADAASLETAVAKEKQRLAELRAKAKGTGDAAAEALLNQIDAERLEHTVDLSLSAALQDPDARGACASRLHDLQVMLDRVEDALRWPALVADAEQKIELATGLVDSHGSASDKERIRRLVQEVREAIAQHDEGLLASRSEECLGYAVRIWRETPDFWVGRFYWLERQGDQMRNRPEANRLLADGRRAINVGNVDTLRSVVQHLAELLPITIEPDNPFSTVMAKR